MPRAINCGVNQYSVFARKNYFYPDLPDGFQTSQFDPPVCVGGHLDIPLEGEITRRVGITRIHMKTTRARTSTLPGRPSASWTSIAAEPR